MDPEFRGIERLGAEIGRAHDALLDDRSPAERAAARRRLVAAAAEPSRSARTMPLVAAAALAAAALAAAVVWWAWPAPRKTAGPAPAPAAAERWLAAPPDAPLEVTLPDETRLTVAAAGRIRLAEPTGEEQRIVLESGSLRARMPKDRGRRWRVAAGPFEVQVTGTEFTVAWEPEGERFSLELHEGSVRVLGPLLADGREVTAGQTLRVFGRQRMELTERSAALGPPAGPSPAARPAESPELPAPPAERPEAPESPAGPAPGSPVEPTPSFAASPPVAAPSAPKPDWEELALARRYAEALAAARETGLDRLCGTLPAASLSRLADVARYARQADDATKLLDCLRRRFPGTPEAAAAAFTYGRVVADVRGNALAATAWFELYLQEMPDGPLAREALGRLLEMYDRLGNAPAARRAAVRYLERFPDGAHAALAQRLAAP